MTIESQRGESLAGRVGEFVARTGFGDIPDEVLVRARHLILDAVGIAFASTTFPFADVARDALTSFESGEHVVLGMKDRLSARDAALLNGILIHGLDFDDTHLPAVAHVTAAVLPAALSTAVASNATTRDLLLAYVLGVEVMARVGMGGAGGLHDVGFHPTAVAGAFGAAVAAGKVMGLDATGLAAAQGIAGSQAAGLMEFLEDGAWTKRFHPGWAAASGLTAASFARAGWTGPPAVYEGRFGLYNTHLATRVTRPDAVVEGLGSSWELLRTAVKPFPVCHFNHAFADAALILRERHAVRAEDIAEIRCAIHPVPRKVVCEPVEAKWAPRDEYDAKFSLPFAIAASLVRGRFTLDELESDARADSRIRELSRKVVVRDDPESAFPAAYSGFVEIELLDGQVFSHREQYNRGHEERPLSDDEIVRKFRGTIGRVADSEEADRVRRAVLELPVDRPAAEFAEACGAR
ncbi:MmgE/PrpD family protein [Amycolatopsis sp. EV170708-02-1]|uniref:MmgE/PrpD family protein n=1 Tax=Amycolatopsis sp. EV170708-02-1 TaxID=2919322 RepID=UPI001F0BF3D9|nr:MmgE/PrpD family protein [Amycolatopsis sp. EV170708-02-1]UMP00067.1 MmgE/PrpD family protein [Amycolatopsis sp. EV170708-02-1]